LLLLLLLLLPQGLPWLCWCWRKLRGGWCCKLCCCWRVACICCCCCCFFGTLVLVPVSVVDADAIVVVVALAVGVPLLILLLSLVLFPLDRNRDRNLCRPCPIFGCFSVAIAIITSFVNVLIRFLSAPKVSLQLSFLLVAVGVALRQLPMFEKHSSRPS
jgi:amino acid transporter